MEVEGIWFTKNHSKLQNLSLLLLYFSWPDGAPHKCWKAVDPTYRSWILHSSRIHHISEHDPQHTAHCTPHPIPWCIYRTSHHTGTNTHTALRHTRDQLPGMHCGTSQESGLAPKELWEDRGQETCLHSNQHILYRYKISMYDKYVSECPFVLRHCFHSTTRAVATGSWSFPVTPPPFVCLF